MLVIFNHGYAALALNLIVSLVRYAEVQNYIVGVVGNNSLASCITLRLPCYNATSMSNTTEGSASRYTLEWFHLVWSKTLILDQVFKLGYHVMFSDADMVYMKPAAAAYNNLLDTYDADGTFMMEEQLRKFANGTQWVNRYINSGSFMLRNNERTRLMMADWMRGFSEHSENNGNQKWLNWMRGFKPPTYALCHTRSECAEVKAKGLAAIKPHPMQYEGMGALCTPKHLPDLCDDRRLYIHAVCLNGNNAKMWAFNQLGLWLLEPSTLPELPQPLHIPSPKKAALPCSTQTAWEKHYGWDSNPVS